MSYLNIQEYQKQTGESCEERIGAPHELLKHCPLGNLDHTIVFIDILFQSHIRRELFIHKTFFPYQHTNWNSLCEFFQDTPWIDNFKRHTEKCATEISSGDKVSIDGLIPSYKHQVQPQSSSWFTKACSATIAHWNHDFQLYQYDSSNHNLLCLFMVAHNKWKRIHEGAKSVL